MAAPSRPFSSVGLADVKVASALGVTVNDVIL
jgi:hypothetical protein